METLNLKGAAAVLHCHPETLKAWARSNVIPATKVGRAWIFSDGVGSISHSTFTVQKDPAEAGLNNTLLGSRQCQVSAVIRTIFVPSLRTMAVLRVTTMAYAAH